MGRPPETDDPISVLGSVLGAMDFIRSAMDLRWVATCTFEFNIAGKTISRYGKTEKERQKYYKLLDLVSYPH
jgi:hypothetical protein